MSSALSVSGWHNSIWLILFAASSHTAQAQEEYLRALKLLEKRDAHADIWDSITWELSSAYFTMATSLQDFAPLTTVAQEMVTICVIIYLYCLSRLFSFFFVSRVFGGITVIFIYLRSRL